MKYDDLKRCEGVVIRYKGRNVKAIIDEVLEDKYVVMRVHPTDDDRLLAVMPDTINKSDVVGTFKPHSWLKFYLDGRPAKCANA